MIRRAKFRDIPQLIEVAHEAHAASKLAGRVDIDADLLKATLRHSIIGPEEPQAMGTHSLVSENAEGRLNGVLIGMVIPMHQCMTALVASNLHWYVRPGTTPGVGLRLLNRFHEWARLWPGKLVLRVSVSDVIDDTGRTGLLLQRMGFEKTSETYDKENF